MKVLMDMNLTPRWMALLSNAGFEATHWFMVGAGNAPDTEIMAFAKVNVCVVLTHDLDFGAILAATQGNKPSVVQIRSEDVSLDAIGSIVVAALQQMDAELNQGALLTVDSNRVRLRVLPLQVSGFPAK